MAIVTSTDCPKSVRNHCVIEAKQKYRGMFKTQKSRNKTSTGEIGLDIRTHASPKVGQFLVAFLCCHVAF